MLSFLTGLALKAGVPQRFAKAAVIVAMFVAAIGGFALLKACYDDGVIDQHDANQRADTAIADRKADTKAAEERRADDARAVTESQEIKEAIHEAGPDPIARRNAYYQCVRAQQAARRAGKPPADC
jgi:hypothetical protein